MTFVVRENGLGPVIAALDHVEDEEILREAEVSSSPVEDGSEVADHTRLLPIGGTFSGLLLDEPGDAETAMLRAAGGGPPLQRGRAAGLLKALQEAMLERKLVTVTTSLELIEDAILTRVVGRERHEGVIRIQGAYRVIRRAATALVALPKPAVKAQASKKKDKGTKSLVPTSGANKQKAIDTILGAFVDIGVGISQ